MGRGGRRFREAEGAGAKKSNGGRGRGFFFLFFLPGISISYSLGNGSPVRVLYYCMHTILSTFLSFGDGVYIPFYKRVFVVRCFSNHGLSQNRWGFFLRSRRNCISRGGGVVGTLPLALRLLISIWGRREGVVMVGLCRWVTRG